MITLKVQGQLLDSHNNNLGKVTAIVLTNVSHVTLTGNFNDDTLLLECLAGGQYVKIKPFKRDKLRVFVKGNVHTLECGNSAEVFGNVDMVMAGNSIYNDGVIHCVDKVGNRIIPDSCFRLETEEVKKKKEKEQEETITQSFSFNSSFGDLFKDIGTKSNNSRNTTPKARYTNIIIETSGQECLQLLKIYASNVELKTVIHGNVKDFKAGNTAHVKGNIAHASSGNCITTHRVNVKPN